MLSQLLRSANSFSAANPYDEGIGFNIKNFGADIGGNWNEPDYDYSGSGTPVANAISLNDGSSTGVTIAYANTTGLAAGDTTGDTTTTTSNIPAPGYDRGVETGGDAGFSLCTVTFSGLPNGAAFRASVGIFVNTTKYTTETGEIVCGEATVTNTVISATTPNEIQIEGNADGSGMVDITLFADAGATNGVGMTAIKLEYAS